MGRAAVGKVLCLFPVHKINAIETPGSTFVSIRAIQVSLQGIYLHMTVVLDVSLMRAAIRDRMSNWGNQSVIPGTHAPPHSVQQRRYQRLGC